jgi:hypothetical protein
MWWLEIPSALHMWGTCGLVEEKAKTREYHLEDHRIVGRNRAVFPQTENAVFFHLGNPEKGLDDSMLFGEPEKRMPTWGNWRVQTALKARVFGPKVYTYRGVLCVLQKRSMYSRKTTTIWRLAGD